MKLDYAMFRKLDPELRIMIRHLDFEPEMSTLEVGCTDTELSYLLQKQGCEAWGVDLRPYPFPLKNFIRGNFLEVALPQNYFDIAIDISAVHHFGLRIYDPHFKLNADMITADKIHSCLKNGGVWFIVMDRFKEDGFISNIGNFVRQYDPKSFRTRIARNFKLEEMRFYDVHTKEVKLESPWVEILYAKLRKENA